MRNRIIFIILALIVFNMTAIEVSAFEKSDVQEFFVNDGSITVYVNDIDTDNVAVRVAGVECEAEVVGNVYSDSEKYQTLFLIDTSKSMSVYADEITAFILNCIDRKKDNEYYSISVFGNRKAPTSVIDFENDRYAVEKAIENIRYDSDSSYIFDNIDNAVEDIINNGDICYKRIVLFTDGCENSATGITIDDVISGLKENPVSVYTVTFLDAKKSNYEQLKNAARIARESKASDIRITAESNINQCTDILFKDAESISEIKFTPDISVADGSVKAVEIMSGDDKITSDIRMPMNDSVVAITETEAVSVTEPVSETAAEPIKDEEGSDKVIIGIIIGVAVIAVVTVIITIIMMRKKRPVKDDSVVIPVSKANNDDTMILSSGGGDTEVFLEDDENTTLILRDKISPDHTFEVSLSSGIIVGRSSDVSSLVIDYDKSISKKHCKIYQSGGKVYVEDLGSANKTFVNETQITSAHLLRTSDELRIGRLKFTVTIR